MIHLLRFNIDIISFFIGVIAAVLVGLIVWGLRRVGASIQTSMKETRQAANLKRQKSLEENYYQVLRSKIRRHHLAFELFALDEILVEPRVILPPPIVDPSKVEYSNSILDELIPYLPDNPLIASRYPITSYPLEKVVQPGGHYFLTGVAGSGKSTALASLALKLSESGESDNKSSRLLPIMVDIHEIDFAKAGKTEPFDLIIQVIFQNLPKNLQKDFSFLLESYQTENNICLLLDSLDELSSNEMNDCEVFIKKLITSIPNIMLITTGFGKSEQILLQNQFTPLTLAGWKKEDILSYIKKWESLSLLEGDDKVETIDQTEPIESQLVVHWIPENISSMTPLQLTLMAWGMISHDLSGLGEKECIKAYIERLCDNVVTSNLGKIVMEMLEKNKSSISIHSLRSQLSSESLNPLINSGFLDICRDDLACFCNPVIQGYFAEENTELFSPSRVNEILDWSILNETTRLNLTDSGGKSLLDAINFQLDTPLNQNLLEFNRLFAQPGTNLETRNFLLKLLFTGLQNEKYPLGERLNLLSGLLIHSGPSIGMLLREISKSPSHYVRQLSALGIGYLQDEKLLPVLEILANDEMLNVRGAAYYALAQFEKASSLDQIINALMDGDEQTKLIAAGALSSSLEGHEILKKAVKSKDILVRRAVVQSIGNIDAEWVVPFLTQISVEDDQWLVRNAAVNSLEQRQLETPAVSYQLTKASEAGWLIQLAGIKGTGIPVGRPPIALLIEILNSGSIEEQLGALDYLKMIPEKEVIQAVYQRFLTSENVVREKAYYSLWWMQISGHDIHSLAV